MRKLYKEFFYIPKYGKIREKVMIARVAAIIAVMIVCLAAISITAYAWFSYNVSSGSNIIKAANFEANVSITITDPNNDPVTVTKDGKVQTASLGTGTYTVELTKGTSTAQTGFCVITIGDTDYYTQQIGVDVERNLTDASVTFTLKVSADTKIEILSIWGTSSYYGDKDENSTLPYIKDHDEIDLTTEISGVDAPPSHEEQGTTGEITMPESTTPTTESMTTTEPSSTPTTTTPPSTEATQPAETTAPETTGTSEPTSTTEPSTSTTEPTATQPVEITTPETTGTSEPTSTTEPSTTTTESTTTQPSETTETKTTQPTETTPSETTDTSEPTDTTEPSASATETSAPAETTEPTATEPTATTASTESQPTKETTGAPTTEASEV